MSSKRKNANTWVNNMSDEMTMAKRRLGTSHWDRKLVANMVALSVSDNYEEAHKEWIATGDVWWQGRGDTPAWIQQNTHPNECLCGQGIVYHFRIQNTENGNEEVVGSDHINSYLIIRAIARETGMNANEITEELIQKWLNVRVKGMKAEAWWKANGEAFERMFNAVKEADLRYNTRIDEYVYDRETRQSRPVFSLIKKRRADEEMASIVWRWNHPDNSRAQINSRGYPNDSLMHDLSMFYVKCLTGLNDKLQAEKDAREARIAEIEEERRRARQLHEERMEQRRLEAEKRRKEQEEYNRKMAPIWEKQRQEEKERQAKLNKKQREQVRAELLVHGPKASSMLEYYGLESVDWELVEYMNLGNLRTLMRYIASSQIKNLHGDSLRRIDQIFTEAKKKKEALE